MLGMLCKIHVPETAFQNIAMQLVCVEVHLKHSWKNIYTYYYYVRIIHILYICINNYDQLIIMYIIYLQTWMEANIYCTRGVRTLTENIPFFQFFGSSPSPHLAEGALHLLNVIENNLQTAQTVTYS